MFRTNLDRLVFQASVSTDLSRTRRWSQGTCYFVPYVSLTPALCQAHPQALWCQGRNVERAEEALAVFWSCQNFGFPSLLSARAPVVRGLETFLPCLGWDPVATPLSGSLLQRSWLLCEGAGSVLFTDGSLSWGKSGCCGSSTSPLQMVTNSHTVLALSTSVSVRDGAL